MIEKLLWAIVFSLALIQNQQVAAQNITTANQSIYIEYGYENVEADDALGQMMFASQRFATYADANFLVIRKYAANAEPKTMNAVVVELVKNLKTGQVYSCFSVGDEKLRMLEGDESELVARIYGAYSDTTYALTKTSETTTKIQNIDCEKWQLSQDQMPSSFLYLTQAVQPSEAIKNLPMFVQRGGKIIGLCLGNDTEMIKTYQLRAQKLEIDKPQNVAEYLALFKDSSKEEINEALKKYLGF